MIIVCHNIEEEYGKMSENMIIPTPEEYINLTSSKCFEIYISYQKDVLDHMKAVDKSWFPTSVDFHHIRWLQEQAVWWKNKYEELTLEEELNKEMQ